MPDTTHEVLLAGFGAAQPYTMEAAAPRSPGGHVVLDRGVVVYVATPETCGLVSGST
ncbi:hypothetical protein [Micromonospora lupini]|uniref:Uncharacterized protein n=1 Tax=Micromonospora lupini str. Lupac 08 TaxID=1150864 RepID=I0KXH1_9ACTN|nr:hypothetical protein [Micromonospora lupini]CCH16268.1 Protein of unknown function [Micromonospora lupini str. Lupac 08]